MLVIGCSYWVVPIQDEDVKTEAGTKLAGETTEKLAIVETGTGKTGTARTKFAEDATE